MDKSRVGSEQPGAGVGGRGWGGKEKVIGYRLPIVRWKQPGMCCVAPSFSQQPWATSLKVTDRVNLSPLTPKNRFFSNAAWHKG